MRKIKDIIHMLVGVLVIISILGVFAGSLVIIWADNNLGGKLFLTSCVTLLFFGFILSMLNDN